MSMLGLGLGLNKGNSIQRFQTLVNGSPILPTGTSDVSGTPINFKDNRLIGLSFNGLSLKNETTYTPVTWAEWTKDAAWSVISSLMTVTNPASYNFVTLPTTFKNNTRYLFLFNIPQNNSGSNLQYSSSGFTGTFGNMYVEGTSGNKKLILTSANPIVNNVFKFYNGGGFTGIISIKDIRSFELTTGSQIQIDADSAMTADQLAARYPFIQGTQSVGLPITNGCANGSFETGTDGIATGYAKYIFGPTFTLDADAKLGLYSQKISYNNTSGITKYPGIIQTSANLIPAILNDKIFVGCWMKKTANHNTVAPLSLGCNHYNDSNIAIGSFQANVTLTTSWQWVSAIINTQSAATVKVGILHQVPTLNGETAEFLIDGSVIINLNTYDLQTLTLAQVNNLIGGYFEGVQGFTQFTSVGKNLFDVTKAKLYNSTFVIQSNILPQCPSNQYMFSEKIFIDNTKNITLKFTSNKLMRIDLIPYDINGNIITTGIITGGVLSLNPTGFNKWQSDSSITGDITVTLQPNAEVFSVQFGCLNNDTTTATLSNIQIEYSNTATTYEAFKTNILSVVGTFTTGDRFDYINGQAYKNGVLISSTGNLYAYKIGTISVSMTPIIPLTSYKYRL